MFVQMRKYFAVLGSLHTSQVASVVLCTLCTLQVVFCPRRALPTCAFATGSLHTGTLPTVFCLPVLCLQGVLHTMVISISYVCSCLIKQCVQNPLCAKYSWANQGGQTTCGHSASCAKHWCAKWTMAKYTWLMYSWAKYYVCNALVCNVPRTRETNRC